MVAKKVKTEPVVVMDPELDSLVPRPHGAGAKRHMLSISEDDYNYISTLAVNHKSTRGRIVAALIKFYRDDE